MNSSEEDNILDAFFGLPSVYQEVICESLFEKPTYWAHSEKHSYSTDRKIKKQQQKEAFWSFISALKDAYMTDRRNVYEYVAVNEARSNEWNYELDAHPTRKNKLTRGKTDGKQRINNDN